MDCHVSLFFIEKAKKQGVLKNNLVSMLVKIIQNYRISKFTLLEGSCFICTAYFPWGKGGSKIDKL